MFLIKLMSVRRVRPSFLAGRVLLLPKNSGNRCSPPAWHLITVPNGDYKLLTAALTKCFGGFYDHIVNPCQSCAFH